MEKELIGRYLGPNLHIYKNIWHTFQVEFTVDTSNTFSPGPITKRISPKRVNLNKEVILMISADVPKMVILLLK